MSSALLFSDLGLPPSLLNNLNSLGYEQPTPVQQQSIPLLLAGHDLLAQAQTGTGKTAAFALPALAAIDLEVRAPQVLIIAPTRELAIQVSEACQSYAKGMQDFLVTPIYGGQDYNVQIKALKRGAHVVVGTPGRLMDHMRRGTLKLDRLKTLVLDEADEMLRMGFIDDVEWILAQIPHQHQRALFSATMPPAIKKITDRYLQDAQHVHIQTCKKTVSTIEQQYLLVKPQQKLEALTRFLEVEPIDAAIIFVRTKTSTVDLAEKLRARGYAAAALNGDLKQSLRKQVLDQVKQGKIDIIIATDVAARGIDIERMSHVINYDIPTDTESYIHRIGRTGRAGRKGKALLVVSPRERRLFRDIEEATDQPIRQIAPPSIRDIQEKRTQELTNELAYALEEHDLTSHYVMVKEMQSLLHCSSKDIAAALNYLLQQYLSPLSNQELDVVEFEARRKKSSSQGKNGRGYSRRKSGGGPKPKQRRSGGAKPGKSHGKPAKSAKSNGNMAKPKRKLKK